MVCQLAYDRPVLISHGDVHMQTLGNPGFHSLEMNALKASDTAIQAEPLNGVGDTSNETDPGGASTRF
jgi:hypothetical protein